MRKIAVLNQKGGVGKTTTVANLGACLAALHRRVLMVDSDPQANLSIHFGVELDRGAPSLYSLLRGEHGPEQVVRQTMVKDLALLPANIDLAGLAVELSEQQEGREFELRRALRPLEEHFGYILIDCPPSLGLLTLNAMCAAGEVFIPLQTEFFALRGLGKLLKTCRLVRGGPNPHLAVTGIIACMFDTRTRLACDVLQEVRKHFGWKVFKTVIRENVRLAEAPGFGLPVTRYDPNCHGAEDYLSLAREVVAMEGQKMLIPALSDSPLPLTSPQEAARSKAG